MRHRVWLVGLPILLLVAAAIQAGQERYDYDALGRLVRFINPAGEGTEYLYDAVGNILAVRQVQVSPPRITGLSPSSLRRNVPTPVVVSGAELLGATVTATDPGLHITGLRASQSAVNFDLTADETVPLGPQPFVLGSSTGTTGFNLTIRPALPVVTVSPSTTVLALGDTSTLTVTLSNPDQEDHQLALSLSNPAVVSLSTATLPFPAGQTSATVGLTVLALGNSVLDLASATLAGTKVGIHVPADEGPGERLRVSNQVGVIREAPASTAPLGPFAAPAVGVVRAPPALATPLGPFAAPAVGVVREPPAPTQPTGPFVSPAVGVVKPAP